MLVILYSAVIVRAGAEPPDALALPGPRLVSSASLQEWPLRDIDLPFPLTLAIRSEEGWSGSVDKVIAGEGDVRLDSLFLSDGSAYTWRISSGNAVREGRFEIADAPTRAVMQQALAAIDRQPGVSPAERSAQRIAALQAAGFMLDAARESGSLQPARPMPAIRRWRDCAVCPEMVEIPAGSIGLAQAAPLGETQQQIQVRFPRPFAVAARETSLGDYRYFLERTGYLPRDEWRKATAGQSDDLPVTGLWPHEVRLYLRWLGRYSGKAFRLLGDYEWEYVARAGAATRYWWGDDSAGACGREYVRHAPYVGSGACSTLAATLRPVASLPPNPFGVHDIYGNASEWVTCAARVTGCESGIGLQADELYSPGYRASFIVTVPPLSGLRLARDLP